MPTARSFIQKTQIIISRYAQILLVLLAFALMVVSSYLFVSNIEHENLRRKVRDAISYTEANIKSDMLEPETILAGISETIRTMILRGDDAKTVYSYIQHINTFMQSNEEKRLLGVNGFYGFFDVYGGRFITGDVNWIPTDDYELQNRPWYRAAVKANGDIGYTQPYYNMAAEEDIITFARRIFNEENLPLGIVCLNIYLDRIRQYAVNTQLTKDGFGFLLSGDMKFIAHPDPSMLGTRLHKGKSGIARLEDELWQKDYISERITTDYHGVKSIVFIEKLYNGWYMGVVTPRDQYYQSTRNLALVLILLGVILSGLLIPILLRIAADKEEAEKRMQVMFDATPLGIHFWDRNYNNIDCNLESMRLFEVSSKKEHSERFFELSPEYQPDGCLSREKAIEMIKKAFDEGYCHFEWMHQKLNGEPIPCEVTLRSTKYKDDFIVVGYIRDLREINYVIKEIEQRERLLNTVNDAANILLSINDEKSFEVSLLKSFELLGRCLDVDRVQIWRNKTIDGELHFVNQYQWLSEYGLNSLPVPIGLHFPYSVQPKWMNLFLNGEYINAPLSSLPESDRGFLNSYGMKSIVIIPMFLEENFWGFFSIDDCRRERTFSDEEIHILTSVGLMMSNAVNNNIQLAKMREVNERIQIMFNTMPLGASYHDKELRVIECNQVTVNIFGLANKQEFFDRFFDLSPEYQPDGRLSREAMFEYINKAFTEGYYRCEWMHQNLNGEPIPCDITLVRVKHNDDFVLTAFVNDLRELRATIATRERAIQANIAKSNFLARISHEVRTPINAILGITEIQLQNDKNPHDTREALGEIYNAGYLLLSIINDILDLSKIEADKMELVPVNYNVASMLNDIVHLNVIRYDSKPIEFAFQIDENIPATLFGDELRIRQILNNLLSNAFKYTDSGEVSLSVAAKWPADAGIITLVFRVSDTGQGMTAEQVDKLFDEYTRFNMEANRTTVGTGLGMAITKYLVQMMNGDILVESEPGRGSSFTVRLPQKTVDGSGVLGKKSVENLKQFRFDETALLKKVPDIMREYMPYGRILIVDDVHTNLYVARGLLAPYGLSVETAESGFEAIEKIRNGMSYDIIFMDHFMPRMDGIETTKIIRELGYKHPIIALTANALAGQAEMFMENGFDGFISKPIDIRQLNAVLNKLVRDRYPAETVEAARRLNDSLKKYNAHNALPDPTDPELVENFIRDTEKSLAILETIHKNNYRETDDVHAFMLNVHAMKSALANIGETTLSDIALSLELAARNEDITAIMAGTPGFLTSLRTVIEKVRPKDENGKISDIVWDDVRKAYLREKLLIIQSACTAYDEKTANMTLTGLRQEAWPSVIKELLAAIAEHLLHSEFEEAAALAGNYTPK